MGRMGSGIGKPDDEVCRIVGVMGWVEKAYPDDSQSLIIGLGFDIRAYRFPGVCSRKLPGLRPSFLRKTRPMFSA